MRATDVAHFGQIGTCAGADRPRESTRQNDAPASSLFWQVEDEFHEQANSRQDAKPDKTSLVVAVVRDLGVALHADAGDRVRGHR